MIHIVLMILSLRSLQLFAPNNPVPGCSFGSDDQTALADGQTQQARPQSRKRTAEDGNTGNQTQDTPPKKAAKAGTAFNIAPPKRMQNAGTQVDLDNQHDTNAQSLLLEDIFQKVTFPANKTDTGTQTNACSTTVLKQIRNIDVMEKIVAYFDSPYTIRNCLSEPFLEQALQSAHYHHITIPCTDIKPNINPNNPGPFPNALFNSRNRIKKLTLDYSGIEVALAQVNNREQKVKLAYLTAEYLKTAPLLWDHLGSPQVETLEIILPDSQYVDNKSTRYKKLLKFLKNIFCKHNISDYCQKLILTSNAKDSAWVASKKQSTVDAQMSIDLAASLNGVEILYRALLRMIATADERQGLIDCADGRRNAEYPGCRNYYNLKQKKGGA